MKNTTLNSSFKEGRMQANMLGNSAPGLLAGVYYSANVRLMCKPSRLSFPLGDLQTVLQALVSPFEGITFLSAV